MLTVPRLLSLDSPTLPSLSIHSHIFPACSILIGPDSLKAPQLETSGGAVNYSVDILSISCVYCVYVCVCVCSSVLKCSLKLDSFIGDVCPCCVWISVNV